MSDYHNPLSVIIPNEFQNHLDFPTEVVAQRFQAYRDIVKDLISYLRQYSSVQEEIVRQQVRLQQAVGAASLSLSSEKHLGGHGHSSVSSRARERHNTINDEELSAINQFFLPIGNGLIQDVPTVLTKFHQQNIQLGTKTLKDITQIIIPKLEDLRRDLLVKIKEIKNLQNDFKNTLSKEMNETRSLLAAFNLAMDIATHLDKLDHDLNDTDTSKRDPFLIRSKLERQLRKQLHEEAYLYEAYKNLQVLSEKLESIVVLEIQYHMGMFLNLVESESLSVPNFLVPSFTNGFLAKEPNLEWDAFVQRNLPRSSSVSHNLTLGIFIDLTFPTRKISDLTIPNYNSLLNVAVREGPLERRSKFLKSYSGGWYVLTCSYLHEFKTADRKKDQHPVLSLLLDHCLVSEHSKNDGKLSGAYKFVLYSKQQNGLIRRGHNWSFRCNTYQTMIEWYDDIKTLTSMASPPARAKAMSKKLMVNVAANDKLSRTLSSVSAHSGMRSLRSAGSKFRSRLSPEVTNSPAPSSAVSHKSTPAANLKRSSLTQTRHRSPKLSNLINSDGTAVASLEDHAKDADSVDPNGNTTMRTLVSLDPVENTPHQAPGQQKRPDAIDLPRLNSIENNGGATSPQQTIPQNYQFYMNLVNQRPQQFYDPVLQQFFTINAIPALQVTRMDQVTHSLPTTAAHSMTGGQQQQQPQNMVQPMPQYFPSSPLPSQSQKMSQVSSDLHPVISLPSPVLPQGQFVPVQGENTKSLGQNIPHFPAHLNEESGASAPYPVHFGGAFDAGTQNVFSSDVGPQAMERKSSIDERVSRMTVNDETEK